jgi:flagellar hook-length control protein FliK
MSDNDDKTEPVEGVAGDAPAGTPEESAADAASGTPEESAADVPSPSAAPASAASAADTVAVDAPWTITITTDPSTAPATPSRFERPRTRWTAIDWGLIIAGIAATTLAVVSSPARRLAVSDWVSTLTPGAFWILCVLVVGVFILLLALLTLIRRAQHRRRAV